jgi:hypothetical protein
MIGSMKLALERLSKPLLEGMEADEATAEGEERLVDVGPSFVAHGQAPHAVEPGQGALDHPAVAAQPLARIDPFAGDADADVALRQRAAAAGDVVRLVGVQLARSLAPSPVGLLDGRDGVEQRLQDDAVVAVRSGQEAGQRDPAALAHNVALRARFAAVRRVGADGVAPLLAGTLAESSEARLQSIWSAVPRRSSSSRWRRSHTPAACQSRKRRQQVTPLPQPISCGSISQGMPDLRTKTMPVRAARSEIRGRPPLGLGGSGGSNGSTSAHNSSLTSGFMPLVYHALTRF